MATSTTSVFVASAVEHLFPIWVELVLCLFSAIVYFMFSSKFIQNLLSPKKQKTAKNADSDASQSSRSTPPKSQRTKQSPLSSPRSSSGSDDADAADDASHSRTA